MRVAVVSPYSWTYPGGVNRHVEALTEELRRRGHDVRVFAPFDHDTRRTAVLHRGARPQAVERPSWLVDLGGSAGWSFNGARSNVAVHPFGVSKLRRELAAFAPDVVHLQEPIGPMCWDTLMAWDGPMVGTFHAYSTSRFPHGLAVMTGIRRRLNRLGVRIAVSEAAAWTGRRFLGGEYRIVPNGVTLPPGGVPAPRHRAPGEPLRIAFVGQAVERKGLPVLVRAFEALRDEVPCKLTIVGAGRDDVEPMLTDPDGVEVLGAVDDDRKREILTEADVLVAPSLGGESFGMVLTEAFAAGTPVVASDIPGYRDVVSDRIDGFLVPRGDATALAETLRELALQPELLTDAGRAAARSAERYAWPQIAAEVEAAYMDAIAVGAPATLPQRLGLRPVGGRPAVRPRRLAPLDPATVPTAGARLRRAAVLGAGGLTAAGAVWGLHRIGAGAIVASLVHSKPAWVVLALGIMCLSMVLRAVSWHAFLKAAVPDARPRFADAFQGITIGVLMSATLPARLGEPARALLVSRRLGRARDRLPAVAGTIVGQTLVNILALALLGAALFSSVGLFAGRQQALVWYALIPLALIAATLVAPALLRSKGSRLQQARRAAARVRSGLTVFRHPRLGAVAVLAQFAAWALQCTSCYVLLLALGLDTRVGFLAAAAVLFAVNVTAVVPITPSNLGVFQASCVAVLTGAYGVSAADALGYGIVLQCIEVATAVVMGAPALVREGLSWKDVRLRTLAGTPVKLSPRPATPHPAPHAGPGRAPSRG